MLAAALHEENNIAVIQRMEAGTTLNSPIPVVVDGDIPSGCHIIAPAVRVNGNVAKQTVIQDHHHAGIDPDYSGLPSFVSTRSADQAEIPYGITVKGEIADFARIETLGSINAASVDDKTYLEARQGITIDNGVGEKNRLTTHDGNIHIGNTEQGTELTSFSGSVTVNGNLPESCKVICDQGLTTIQGNVEPDSFIYAESETATVRIAGDCNGVVENKLGNTFVEGSVNTIGREDGAYIWSDKGNVFVKGDANQSVESAHGQVQSRDTQTDRGRY